MPPHGLVAVVPLADFTPRHGPTEFLVGSHVQLGDGKFWCGGDFRRACATSGVRDGVPKVYFASRKGSVVLFDMRLRHRGGANTLESGSRALLYMSYCKGWFRDAVNFRQRQGRSWDALPSAQMRSLLSRLDSRAYVSALESALRRHGVDVEQELVSAAHLQQLRAQMDGSENI